VIEAELNGASNVTQINLDHARCMSRRGILRGAALIAGGGAIALAAGAALPARAAAKMAQKQANYQPIPKGNAHCNNCALWLQPTDCKVVVGPVSPTGWCSLYAAKW
jgi:hypothetical protein